MCTVVKDMARSNGVFVVTFFKEGENYDILNEYGEVEAKAQFEMSNGEIIMKRAERRGLRVRPFVKDDNGWMRRVEGDVTIKDIRRGKIVFK
jgi:hypothetical protein